MKRTRSASHDCTRQVTGDHRRSLFAEQEKSQRLLCLYYKLKHTGAIPLRAPGEHQLSRTVTDLAGSDAIKAEGPTAWRRRCSTGRRGSMRDIWPLSEDRLQGKRRKHCCSLRFPLRSHTSASTWGQD